MLALSLLAWPAVRAGRARLTLTLSLTLTAALTLTLAQFELDVDAVMQLFNKMHEEADA